MAAGVRDVHFTPRKDIELLRLSPRVADRSLHPMTLLIGT
jgi:hypothetical protein